MKTPTISPLLLDAIQAADKRPEAVVEFPHMFNPGSFTEEIEHEGRRYRLTDMGSGPGIRVEKLGE